MPYVLLVILLSLPFWALAQVAQAEPLPGLPLSGLMAFVPALAAILLVARAQGAAGVRALLARSLDVRRMQGHGRAWALVPLAVVVTWLPALAQGGLTPQSPDVYWAPFVMLAAFFVYWLNDKTLIGAVGGLTAGALVSVAYRAVASLLSALARRVTLG